MNEPITGKGFLGVILMRALNMGYNDSLDAVDYIRAYCKHHGYIIKVEKDPEIWYNKEKKNKDG